MPWKEVFVALLRLLPPLVAWLRERNDANRSRLRRRINEVDNAWEAGDATDLFRRAGL